MLDIKAKHKKNKKFQSKQENIFEIYQDIVVLKLQNKDGRWLEAKFDLADLSRVEQQRWLIQWHKDLNYYGIITETERVENGKHRIEKKSLASFLLDLHPKVPIQHLNGDMLDYRSSNLAVYHPKSKNDYEEINSTTMAILLRDQYGRSIAKALIDTEELHKIEAFGCAWVCHKVKGRPYAVANTPAGRVFLGRFILEAKEDTVIGYMNRNTLDCRKANLQEIQILEEEND